MELKTHFINKCLARYNQDVIDTMRTVAKRMGVGVTDEGMQSLAYKIHQAGSGASSELSFKEYLRMVDMGAGRGHPLGGLAVTKINLQASNKSGFAQVKNRGRKPKKFYSKIAYGKLTGLYNQLLYGYTEETIALLKAEMQNKPVL